MARIATVLLLTLLLTGVAGCADNKSPKTSKDGGLDQAADNLDLQATSTTGVVRGVVVDNAIKPLGGATVTLRGTSSGRDQATTSNEQGAFGFDGLDAGSYFLTVHKLGYFDTQQSVDVVAGVTDPHVVKVLLAANPTQLAGYEVFDFEGFLECSVTYVLFFSSCKNPVTGEPVGNNHYEQNFATSGNASWVHVSLVWKPTQPFGTELYFNLCDDVGPCNAATYNGGVSPLVGDASGGDLDHINQLSQVGIEVSGNGEQGSGVGVEAQQGFHAYIVVFHNFTPPDGYAFWRDGEPTLPN